MTEGMRGKSLEESQKTYKNRPVEDVLMYVAANQDLISAKQDFLKEDIVELKEHMVKQNGNVARNVRDIAKNALAIGKNEAHLEDACKKLEQFIDNSESALRIVAFLNSKLCKFFITAIALALATLSGVSVADFFKVWG
jgi:uncharacterized protein YydD (DUF2326 family)